jgi:hypothetical protein
MGLPIESGRGCEVWSVAERRKRLAERILHALRRVRFPLYFDDVAAEVTWREEKLLIPGEVAEWPNAPDC